MRIYLDDIRVAPEGWLRVPCVDEAVRLMSDAECVDLSLDHDLGDYARFGGDAIKLVLWMCENDVWPINRPTVHSANPVGRANMDALIDRYGPYS